MRLRRIATHWKARQWRRVIEELPLWVTTLLVALPFALRSAQILVDVPPLSLVPKAAALYPVAVLLLVVRDCAIYVFFALSSRPRGPEGVTLLYIALASWILPAVLAVAGLGAAAQLLMPFGSMNGWQASLVMGAQVAIVERGRVLLQFRPWPPGWELPGGHCKPGEDPAVPTRHLVAYKVEQRVKKAPGEGTGPTNQAHFVPDFQAACPDAAETWTF